MPSAVVERPGSGSDACALSAGWVLRVFGLPEDFDGSFLVGRCLLQVCVGLHEVILKLDEDVEITVECAFRVKVGAEDRVYDSPPLGGAAVLPLLQQIVVAARGAVDGTLSVEFPSGAIVLYDTSPSYECYQLRDGAKLYVV